MDGGSIPPSSTIGELVEIRVRHLVADSAVQPTEQRMEKRPSLRHMASTVQQSVLGTS